MMVLLSHGEGADRVLYATPPYSSGIPRDGAVGHGEGATVVRHTATAVVAGGIAGDGAVGHGEGAAVRYTPPP